METKIVVTRGDNQSIVSFVELRKDMVQRLEQNCFSVSSSQIFSDDTFCIVCHDYVPNEYVEHFMTDYTKPLRLKYEVHRS